MTVASSVIATLGECSLASLAEPSVRYGHACTRNRVDRGHGPRAPRRRQTIRSARWRALRDAVAGARSSGGDDVEEYWIVDLDARVIERWRKGKEGASVEGESFEWQPASGRGATLPIDVA